METPQSILVIRLKSIGDVVLALPAVHALRENFPSAKITFLTSRENSVLLRGFRDVDEVIALDRAKLRSGHPLKVTSEFFGLLWRLRAGKFSLAVDFQGYGETAWLARLTGAPQRWGGIYGKGREWAYTRSFAREEKIHPAAANLSLLQQCGLKTSGIKNEFILPSDALDAARKIFRENRLDAARPTLFIQSFTSMSHKNWPLENYLTVARHWSSLGVQIIFGGGPADLPALQSACAGNFCVAAGVPLLVTGGLMQLSTLVLGGDTGALHLAVAQGKRVLMLMHEVEAGSPVPFQHPDWVIAAPERVAIARIPLAEVNAAIAPVLEHFLH